VQYFQELALAAISDTSLDDLLFQPRSEGRCLVPPMGLTFFEYKPAIHGPLVNCRYPTAAYDVEQKRVAGARSPYARA